MVIQLPIDMNLELQETFGLDAMRSASILEVISLLHRDSLAS